MNVRNTKEALLTGFPSADDDRKLVDVAVAVIMKADGEFLLAKRPEGKPYAGYWEFPGGKVEHGESVYDALVREIKEELGVRVEQAYPWITQVFSYPHALVKLHFYRVTQWHGDPHPHEKQEFSWQAANDVCVTPLLPANGPVLNALALPCIYGISNAAELGTDAFLDRLESALKNGLRLVQVREKMMSPAALSHFAENVVRLAHSYGAKVAVNSDAELARAINAEGVHLSSRQLKQMTERPDMVLVGASCHNREELERAVGVGVDYVLLGPVMPTLSHPGLPSLGWQCFAEMIKDMPMPVYAIGGLQESDLISAWQHGAHGIAMLRGAWKC